MLNKTLQIKISNNEVKCVPEQYEDSPDVVT